MSATDEVMAMVPLAVGAKIVGGLTERPRTRTIIVRKVKEKKRRRSTRRKDDAVKKYLRKR